MINRTVRSRGRVKRSLDYGKMKRVGKQRWSACGEESVAVPFSLIVNARDGEHDDYDDDRRHRTV